MINSGTDVSGRALTLSEVVLSCAILVFGTLLLLSRLPRAREESRAVSCISNLAQIGQAMLLYGQNHNDTLPVVNIWSGIDANPGTSPLFAFRQDLQIGDFLNVNSQIKSSDKSKFNPEPQRIAGLRCPSDRSIMLPLSTNYRANTGVNARGESGTFSIGSRQNLNEIEKLDGLAFTAAFSERLLGDGTNGESVQNYRRFEICQDTVAFGVNGNSNINDVQGNAGHDWSRGDWRNTLYHHGLLPNWKYSAIAVKDNCGQMGTSSGHVRNVNVLLLDGSVRSWKDTVDPIIWKRLGGISDGSGN